MKTSLFLLAVTVALALLLSACGQPSSESAVNYEMAASDAWGDSGESMAKLSNQAQSAAGTVMVAPKMMDRKLIKTGEMKFETPDLKKSTAFIKSEVSRLGGYISNETEYAYNSLTYQEITVRIPAQAFDSLWNALLASGGTIEAKSVNVQDVTEEFYDVKGRIETKKALEGRYLQLLAQAKTVTEMLEIEREIGNLRTEIESMEGRIKFLSDQVSMSTLRLVFHEPATETVISPDFAKAFANGFKSGYQNLIWFFVGLMSIWPFLLIIGISIFLLKKWWKKRTTRQ